MKNEKLLDDTAQLKIGMRIESLGSYGEGPNSGVIFDIDFQAEKCSVYWFIDDGYLQFSRLDLVHALFLHNIYLQTSPNKYAINEKLRRA